MTRQLRLALAGGGDPTDPAALSGVLHGLAAGLRSWDAEVHAVAAEPEGRAWVLAQRAGAVARLRPADLRAPRAAIARAWPGARLGRVAGVARAAHLRRAVAALPPGLAGIVQYGTEFTLPAVAPLATYEDMTVRQALRGWRWPHLGGAGRRDLDRYDAQAARTYARARAVCALTHWAAASMRDDYGVPAERVHVVGLGRPGGPDPPPDRDWSVPRFLFVGFDWERKGGPALLRAFARVREAHPAATLDLVGGHPAVDEPGVTGHGVLPPGDPEAMARSATLWARATTFVMPSQLEPAGIVHATAGGVGIPSIGTSRGGAPTIIGDGGWLAAPGDDAALLAAMLEACDPERARVLGARALQHSAKFTWRMVAGRILRALGAPLDGLPEPL